MNKLFFVAFALFLLCDSSPVSSPDPVGIWSGFKNTVPVSVVIESNGTYGISIGAPAILYEESGSWIIRENAVTLSPLSCREYGVSIDCGSAEIFVIDNNTMTELNGTITLIRK
jgi:hypothetical protein